MRRVMIMVAATGLAVFALVLPASAVAAHAGTAQRLGFALTTPNTAVAARDGMMAMAGDRITVTGGGSFVPTTGSVRAGGSFVHYRADGTVHCRGTWTATELTGWVDLTPTSRGRHGGVISLLVTHVCTMAGDTHTAIPMTVTSTSGTPAGSTAAEGVTVGEFTVPISGRVVIAGR
jgi:hypothetical protein